MFSDSSDDLRDQSDGGKFIKEEVGPIVGQRILVLRIIRQAVKSCLLRRRGWPLLCQISPIFSESLTDGESALLRRCCSVTAFLRPGSVCLAHALLWVNAGCAVPNPRGVPLKWRGASRRALLGDLCRPPRSCCLSRPERGAPSGLVKRHEGLDTLQTFLGSWCEDFLPPSTTGRSAIAQMARVWARARSGVTAAFIWTESKTVPRNDIRWLGDSVL